MTGRPDAPGADRRAAAWVWLPPVLVALAMYARTLGFAFVWDDVDLVVRNAGLQGGDWSGLLARDFWQSTGGGTGMWRPLVTLSYRLDGVLSGWQPWMFHLANSLAHAVAAGLVAILARSRRLPTRAAVAAGLVYATAPALSESAAWVSGRTDALASMFTLAALCLARRARTHGGLTAQAGLLACVGLALLAKESALVLPLLLAADAADDRDTSSSPFRRPLASAAAVVLVWAFVHRALVPGPAHEVTPGAISGMAALLWAHLPWLLPWMPHSPLLDLWAAPAAGVALAAWLALICVAALLMVLVRRRVDVALPVTLLIAPLLPVVAASALETGVRFAERSLTIPAAGLALMLAWLAAGVAPRARRPAQVLLGVWILVQAAYAWPAVGAWRNEESRIRRIVSVRPHDLDALLGLADLLSTEGRRPEALDWIRRAEAAAPLDARPSVARATLAYRGGQLDEALAAAETALRMAPDDLAAGVVRVRALARMGRGVAAVAAGRELVERHPDAAAAEGALGASLLARGDPAAAISHLARGSGRLLDDAGLAWDFGRAALATSDIATARLAFERAVAASPAFYEAWLGVADTRARLGDAAGAEAALARAAALPESRDGRVDMLRARGRGR